MVFQRKKPCSITRTAVLLVLGLLTLRHGGSHLYTTALDWTSLLLIGLLLHHRFWHRHGSSLAFTRG